jgi:murein DD-endopeptidase MepM/ murein hydrolase activator NlpD
MPLGSAFASRATPTRAPGEIKSQPPRTSFNWPVRGTVTSRYGKRGFASWHRGVDIKTPQGTPIRAAAAGTVIFSGRQSSYGRVIKIAHPDGRSTVYAHNHANLVKAGDRVKAGTVIGTVGRTGRATTNHLHFEIRRQGVAQDPLPLLDRRPSGPVLAKGHDVAERGTTSSRHRPSSEIKVARAATR